MKQNKIGCCTSDCPNRSATCMATCKEYRQQREANMKTYEQRRQVMDVEDAVRGVQYNGLRRSRK